MEPLLKFIFDLVIWGLVPILLGMALWEIYTYANQHSGDHRIHASIRGGFWAGFILFIVILIYQVGGFFKTGFPEGPLYRGFDLWLVFSGAILAFLLLSGGRKVIPLRLKGWSIFAASFFNFYAIFHYFFIRTYNEPLLSLVLGVALGLFVHHIVYPPAQGTLPIGRTGH